MIRNAPLFEIVNPALLSLLVDSGREGQQHRGICASGPMDVFAYNLCNQILGVMDTVVIEVSGGAFELKTLNDIDVCITGLNGGFFVNNHAAPMCEVHRLCMGDVLSIPASKTGFRSYIGVNARLTTKQAYGSYSTVMRERSGGLKGNGFPLMRGDILQGEKLSERFKSQITAQNKTLQQILDDVYLQRSIRLVKGEQFEQFESLAWHRLLANPYYIENDSNRMGIRLNGQSVSDQSMTMRSEALTMGAMQIPPNGQPIVLMADRQTLGGYPKIANVAMVDLPLLAQQQPGSKVDFKEIDMESARNQWRLQNNSIHNLRKHL